MRLDRTEQIAGYSVKAVRDFLRRMDYGSWSSDLIAEHFGISKRKARGLIVELCDRKLLQKSRPWRGERRTFYEHGEEASRFASARFLKPIDRRKADELVQGLLARVKEVNADPDLVYIVEEVRVFGSYIKVDRVDFGDVDIAIRLKPRDRSRKITDQSIERANASGRIFSNYLEKLFYAQHEVIRRLSARKPHLSIHEMHDLDEIGAESRVIFSRPKRRAAEPEVTEATRGQR